MFNAHRDFILRTSVQVLHACLVVLVPSRHQSIHTIVSYVLLGKRHFLVHLSAHLVPPALTFLELIFDVWFVLLDFTRPMQGRLLVGAAMLVNGPRREHPLVTNALPVPFH